MLIDRVVGARVPGGSEVVDLHLAGGFIDEVTGDERPATVTGSVVLPVDGKVVVPAFVDAHVHLDKAYLLQRAEAEDETSITPHLDSAIAAVAALRGTVTSGAVKESARRAVEALIRQGVTAARVQVELDPAVGLELVDLHHELVAEFAGRIELQGVAFPQPGLDDPQMPKLLAAAMDMALPVVGGCPYVDDDPAAHLDVVFALAEQHQVPLDLHLDFGDDPRRSLIDLVVERTKAHGLQGRVAIGHVTTLAAMAASERAAALDALAQAGIALIVLPATDLYLAGQGGGGQRAIAPIMEAHAAGVLVAVGNNNINNPFSPFGNASPLQAVWLAGIVGLTTAPADRATLLAAITDHPARILGLPARHIVAGAPADLVVLDATDPDDAVSQAPTALATIRAGALVHSIRGPEPITR